MKEYETLTREKVDVVPFGCGMPETHLMQDWSDRMLDLILNGPTINGIKKDEVRAMLRETYAALKQYEKIGPMASPFINDPTAIVARAFSELYPGIEYVAQYVPDQRDETNGTAYGLTIFPDDGSTPIVCISAKAPISAAPELLAHELAHVATPEDTEHGESWSAASEAIFKKYNELLDTAGSSPCRCAITSRSLRRTTGSSPPAPSVALSAGRQTRPAGSSHWSPTSEPPAQPAR